MNTTSNGSLLSAENLGRSGFRVERVAVAPAISLEVETTGPPEAPLVVFLHGGGQTRRAWRGASHQMTAAGYRVLLFDARGHGGSDWSPDGDYRLSSLAADLLGLLAAERRPVALVGASMGGMTSFLVAGQAAERVGSLILVDTVPAINQVGAERVRGFMTAHQNGFGDIAEAAEAIAAYNPQRRRPTNPSGLMRYLRESDDGRLYWHWDPRLISARRVDTSPDAIEARSVSAAITAPTLLIHGSLSDVVDEAGIRDLQTIVPQTEVVRVEGAGHMVAGDRNDAFNDAVLAFLSRHFLVDGRTGSVASRSSDRGVSARQARHPRSH